MEFGAEAALWVVNRALGTVSSGLLDAWAASSKLGPNVEALRMELLYAQGMLNNARGRGPDQQIQNRALEDLLQKLRDLAYRADDVLDELEYFRIQDELDLTYHAADDHGGGCLCNHALHARSAAKTMATMVGCSNIIHTTGKHLPRSCCGGRRFFPCLAPQREPVDPSPKLQFDRVRISQTMLEIVEQLKPVCAKVSTILNLELLDSNRSIAQYIATSLDTVLLRKQWHTPRHRIAFSRPNTTSKFIEPKFHGRKDETSKIIDEIIKGECQGKELTVLPIVGPGGIGKTTLVQHIYNNEEIHKHFEVKLWVCVSVNFDVHRLKQEIVEKLGVTEKVSQDKQIEEGLKSQRFLLVLDDMWNCIDEDEWKRFLVPFKTGQTEGNVIITTTRFPALAKIVETKKDYCINLEGLDSGAFKELFFACIFGDNKPHSDHNKLTDTGYKIMEKLKGNPLAAKTVGRLLRTHLDLDHWTRVLESKEWESQNLDNGIMPALKLSFDYLPFHLQQCFIYCALFPEDYRFCEQELIHLWVGFDVLHSHGENKSIESIGQDHLIELVNYGFFKKEDQDGQTCYVIHDLQHELALKVSARECLSIYSYNVRSIQIPPSIRHLSINIDDSSVKDRKTFDICKDDFSALQKKLKVENLHSLMLFGEHQGSFVKTFHDLFSKAKALRVIFISGHNYSVEDLLQNFNKLVHLRYIRIHSGFPYIKPRRPKNPSRFYVRTMRPESQPPKNISRFYHMRIIDVQGCSSCYDLARYVSNLVSLRHFLVQDDRMHSSIFEVGRLESLQELRNFEVKKESKGFELRRIGDLQELNGSLCIDNLENIEAKEEADQARLMQKKHLQELILKWDAKGCALEEQVLEGLKPHSNIQKLCIIGHGGANCPSWLHPSGLSVKKIESLCLDGVAWRTFPPLGELWLVNEELSSKFSGQNFENLRKIELIKLPGLKKWVIDSTCPLFSQLEVLSIRDCSELEELSFSYSSCSEQDQMTWFTRLRELVIIDCPKLVSLPPLPWTRAPCFIGIEGVGLGFDHLTYEERFGWLWLKITGKNSLDESFWTALDFDNLTKVQKLRMQRCPPLPLDQLQKLSSLKELHISNLDNAFWSVQDGNSEQYQFPVEDITLSRVGASGKELTQLFSYMPRLSTLSMWTCGKIEGLGVVEQEKNGSSSSNQVGAQITAVPVEEGMLLLPPTLHELRFFHCRKLSLRSNPLVVDDKGDGQTGGGGVGLQGLCSLRYLVIDHCPEFFSSFLSSSSSGFPFPASLRNLMIDGIKDMETLVPLSNLTSLTELSIHSCGDLRGEGLWRLLAQGCLAELAVFKTLNFFVDVPCQLHGSSKPLKLRTDSIAAVLVVPICSVLSSSLIKLELWFKGTEMKRLAKEQEEALQCLTSLQELEIIGSKKLQHLPAGLHNLLTLETLKISSCPAIRVLPKGGLPISLRVLDVQYSFSKHLSRRCHKLIGTIPIVDA